MIHGRRRVPGGRVLLCGEGRPLLPGFLWLVWLLMSSNLARMFGRLGRTVWRDVVVGSRRSVFHDFEMIPVYKKAVLQANNRIADLVGAIRR